MTEDHVTLCLAGEIDMSTAPKLREAALNALHQYGPNLHLDLSRVEFMDSTGLEVLIATRRRAKLEGGQFHLVDPGQPSFGSSRSAGSHASSRSTTRTPNSRTWGDPVTQLRRVAPRAPRTTPAACP